MESSKKKAGSVEIPKRNRSLDLKSLYKSRVSEVGESEKKVSKENEREDVKKKKRKSRKEVSLSCFESDAKKSKKENGNGAEPVFDQESSGGSGSKGLHGISLSLSASGAFNFPRRPRGSVGRRKLESDRLSQPVGTSDSGDREGAINDTVRKSEDKDDRLVRLIALSAGTESISNSKSTGKVRCPNSKLKQKLESKSKCITNSSGIKLKRKAGEDKVKESRNDRSGTVRRAEKDGDLAVNNGDTSSKKRRIHSRKKKELVVNKDGSEASNKKTEPSVGSSVADSIFVDLLDDEDDDEENLEENAAMMLSSRFDPSCTGFSSKRKSSVHVTNGSSFPVSARDSRSRRADSAGGMESADDASRSLRPRREEKGTGPTRIRRHFYEIHPEDLDAQWVLSRRIKVFWPLDESWYHGLLNDYDNITKLHHIKYDDRDEEWVNLRQEQFKLLLLPSEVPEKSKPKRQRNRNKNVQEVKTVPPSDDDSCIGDDLDSVPIASWLSLSSQRFKSLPRSLKKQRNMHLPMVSSFSSEKTDNSLSNMSDSHVAGNKQDSESALGDDSVVQQCNDKFTGATSNSQSSKPLVYVRKKQRKESESISLSAGVKERLNVARMVAHPAPLKVTKKSESISLSAGVKARLNVPRIVARPAPLTVRLPSTKVDKTNCGYMDSEKQLWLVDSIGEVRLNVFRMKCRKFRFQVNLPVYPYLEYQRATCDLGLLHDMLMLQHGFLVATSPAVKLEILFIDNNHGLRFLLFEGCLSRALAFIFLILVAFSQCDEHWNSEIQLPVTSIRFRLFGAQDVRKHHAFAFYCFSRIQSSKWLFLNSKLLQDCRLIKQLPVSECTHDNIKDLECGNSLQHKTHVGLGLLPSEGCKRRLVPGVLPMGVTRKASNTRMSRSAFTLTVKPGKVPHFALSFSAAPTFFLNLHLQLLMEHSFACIHLHNHDRLCTPESSENGSQFKSTSSAIRDGAAQPKLGTLTNEASAFMGMSSSEHDAGADGILATNFVKNVDSSRRRQRKNPNGAGTARGRFKEIDDEMLEAELDQSESTKEVHEKSHVSSLPSVPTSIPPTSSPRCDSGSDGMIVDVPSFEQVDQPFDGKGSISRQTSDADWSANDGFVNSPSRTGSRSLLKRGRSSSISSSLGGLSPVWPDGKTNFLHIGLSNGPKKPRTQVQYTLPIAGYDFSAKQKVQNQRALPCKRIRRASLKRMSDGSRTNQKNLELLACDVNILVTHGDRGWRECGARVVLEVADHNEWRLAVKLSGITKYSYKVKHILQPGSTNRFSHAMMWKGGKDWVLEFPERSQWTLFKEMYEECHNRNIRAASVKNIPIPGVQLIEENDDYGTEVPFVRNPTKYFRQNQTDVEMALDPSRIFYDLDSDDEQWLLANKGTDQVGYEEISEDFLEKTIDMFEKVSYIQHRDNFTDAEIEELVIGMGSGKAAKLIYEHWRQKREIIGMPLIRHLQPPLWERYQQKLKEWENNVPRGNGAFSVGNQEKVPPAEKPPMFAFCLKPRGLDVPNKGSKQRSHRKFPVSAHHHAASGDPDSYVFGRRSNGHTFGDEKLLYAGSFNEYSDVSPGLHASMRVLSPRDAHFSLSTDPNEWNRDPKVYKNKTKKHGAYSLNNQQMISYNQRTIVNRNGVQQWNMSLPEYFRQKHPYIEGHHHRQGVEQLDGSELDEFRLRDASNAAKHARFVAKLKRERAQKLLYRADLSIHKAVVALMTAEAMKAAHENPKGDS